MSPETHPYARRWQALIILAMSLLVISVGNTILGVALPTIQEELDASSSELQWIVDGYMLVYAGLLLAAGTLGDRFGRRKALVTGLLTFALGSVFAALSGGATELIASRAIMGVGAAVAGLTAVVWGLIEAPERGWTEPVILAAFAGGAAILAAFVAWERRVEQPMLQVGVFRNLRFSAASASITFVYFSLMGVMYFMTTYMQSVLGFSALEAGIRMLPIAAGLVLTAKPSVLLTKRLGTKLVVAGGLATVSLTLVA